MRKNIIQFTLKWIVLLVSLHTASVSHAQEPWVPYMVKDIVGTSGSHAQIEEVTPVGNVIFFRAYTTPTGIELWKTDGTPEGTAMVKDVRPGPNDSGLKELTDVNGTLFFVANDGPHGQELWKSDGTEAGTVIVKDWVPGERWLFADSLVNLNGKLIMSCGIGKLPGPDVQVWQQELCYSDGTSVGLLKNINHGPPHVPDDGRYSSHPKNPVVVGDAVYFSADDWFHGRELWKTDGTEAGTALVKDIFPGWDDSRYWFGGAEWAVHLGETLYFVANDGIHFHELWKTDGTESGTVMVKDTDPTMGWGTAPKNLAIMNETLFFLATDGDQGLAFWKSDGTEAGTTQFYSPGPSFTSANGLLWFSAYHETYGVELWRSDGTPEGAFMLKDINPTPQYSGSTVTANSNAAGFIPFNGRVIFSATDGTHGKAIWESDGTPAGTQMVVDILPERDDEELFSGVNKQIFWEIDGKLLFLFDDGIHGRELWITDLTSAKASMLKDINLMGNSHSDTEELIDINGMLFFIGDDKVHGREIWKSDGTQEGTVMVKDLYQDWMSPYISPMELIDANGTLYFTTFPRGALYKSDGTAEGTVPVWGHQYDDPWQVSVRYPFNANGTVYFIGAVVMLCPNGYSNAPRQALWKTDGTLEGTVQLTWLDGDSDCWFYGEHPRFSYSNGLVYFRNWDPEHGWEPWKTDGTPEGTVMLKDINPGGFEAGGNYNPYNSILRRTAKERLFMVDVNGTLFFNANTESDGMELWKTNGTEEGTVLVTDLYPGMCWSPTRFKYVACSSYPLHLTNFNDKLFFKADNGEPAETLQMLWYSDGTTEGTINIRPPMTPRLQTDQLTVVGNTLFFRGIDNCIDFRCPGIFGAELWRTDGTDEGTILLDDMVPGPDHSYSQELTDVDGILVYRDYDDRDLSAVIRHLRKSDGTPEGTVTITQGDHSRYDLTNVNGTVFFVHDDGIHGEELWAMPTWKTVDIDVKPGKKAKFKKKKSHGVIPVTIFGSVDLSVHDIEPASLKLNGLEVKMSGKSNKYLVHYDYINKDNYIDLKTKFEMSDDWVVNKSGSIQLTGKMNNGIRIKGSDRFCIRDKKDNKD